MVWPSIAVLVSMAILFGVLNIGQDEVGLEEAVKTYAKQIGVA
jgi:hypothetical protein